MHLGTHLLWHAPPAHHTNTRAHMRVDLSIHMQPPAGYAYARHHHGRPPNGSVSAASAPRGVAKDLALHRERVALAP